MAAIVLIVLAVIALVFILGFIGVYNGLVRSRNQTEEAASDIDVQLKRRHDLIPNLVETVKGYATQEKTVLEDVTKARADAIAAGSQGVEARDQAENVLTQALRSVFSVVENYPDLKSSANFQQLSAQLTDTEDKILAARRFYNNCAREYNSLQQTFPAELFARSMGFTPKDYLTVDSPEDRVAPQVHF